MTSFAVLLNIVGELRLNKQETKQLLNNEDKDEDTDLQK